MADIDLTEAVAAGAQTYISGLGHWSSIDDRVKRVLTAALPHIERQVREQVAREIEAMRADQFGSFSERDPLAVRSRAARIARGDS